MKKVWEHVPTPKMSVGMPFPRVTTPLNLWGWANLFRLLGHFKGREGTLDQMKQGLQTRVVIVHHMGQIRS